MWHDGFLKITRSDSEEDEKILPDVLKENVETDDFIDAMALFLTARRIYHGVYHFFPQKDGLLK